MSGFDLPKPTIFESATTAQMTMVADAFGEDYIWHYTHTNGLGMVLEEAFKQIGTALDKYIGCQPEGPRKLHSALVDRSVCDPHDTYNAGAASWHADFVAQGHHTVLIHSAQPAQYLFGHLKDEVIKTVFPFWSGAMLSAYQLEQVGTQLRNNKTDSDIVEEHDLRIIQPLPYMAQLLSARHLHRSPINILPVPQERIFIKLDYADHSVFEES